MASPEHTPTAVLARKGRLRQRYDNEYRLVAGCVPYRVAADGKPEVLMISTPNRDDLVFPKGGWEDDEDVYEAASREAMEEAGVKGNIDRTPLGLWVFRSKSSQVDSDSPRGACKGYIYALEVAEELDQWPEQDTHGRQWLLLVMETGLPGGRVRPVPVRVDARGALGAAGPPACDLPLPASGDDEACGAGAERARWHLHDDESCGNRGASNGALLINITRVIDGCDRAS